MECKGPGINTNLWSFYLSVTRDLWITIRLLYHTSVGHLYIFLTSFVSLNANKKIQLFIIKFILGIIDVKERKKEMHIGQVRTKEDLFFNHICELTPHSLKNINSILIL